MGISIISKYSINAPGDNLSSGDSSIMESRAKIDNYRNVNNYLYDREFVFWEKIDILDGKDEFPQGICVTEDYVLISLYSETENSLGRIKIFDKESGEYLLSLGFDNKSHMGGIAYDGNNIWVCNSARMSLEKISYDFIKKAVSKHKGQMVDVRNLVEEYSVKNIPSSVTYYDGYLWVVTHSAWTREIMMSYQLDKKENELKLIATFGIPAKVQGAAFTERGEIYLSVSYGRSNDSYLIGYSSIYEMTRDEDNYIEKIKLPPCSEEIVYENGLFYVLFESAASKYLEGSDGKGKSTAPLDKILIISE